MLKQEFVLFLVVDFHKIRFVWKECLLACYLYAIYIEFEATWPVMLPFVTCT
ncbi:hypothetical protein DPMN_000779 [Dreissena polymorpha]|uniref:Uncharacterized protein n=1 Tax=Dreissena polymorpha TaxID=45954 RepID=A0A9D4MKE7_DREPO|nr:hypothetical protein DPMN_000779 [Dreissena polymorpha]